MIESWFSGICLRARQDHYDYVCRLWQAKKDNGKRVPLTPERRQYLAQEADRTGLGPYMILRRASGVPAGLSANIIYSWHGGIIATARKEYWDYVVTRYNSLPDKKPAP